MQNIPKVQFVLFRDKDNNSKKNYNHPNNEDVTKSFLPENIFDIDNNQEYNNEVTKRNFITSLNLSDNIRSDEEHQINNNSDQDFIIKCRNPILKSESHTSRSSSLIPLLLKRKNQKQNEANDSLSKTSSELVYLKESKIPIDSFGMAMLKGMGYDPSIHKTRPKLYKKRTYDQGGLGSDLIIDSLFQDNLDLWIMPKLIVKVISRKYGNHLYNNLVIIHSIHYSNTDSEWYARVLGPYNNINELLKNSIYIQDLIEYINNSNDINDLNNTKILKLSNEYNTSQINRQINIIVIKQNHLSPFKSTTYCKQIEIKKGKYVNFKCCIL
ncbi:uncharacterized protein CMU_027990 [Cryptosporidium muris RN66]|uniref:Spp2/MOS2 G-patch domain-containing protein n=1 Tax=Cryptosporidium muris (strain RN66) TaxID=441375 RepID=B6ABN7_CRYMR|nr:uncharacterized protein CMU_027990 [Cryptosporidium muris RN66]EEA05789.1 hypothetical protein CMU_027990 [Cryptosporidium muris RN66]|eukprot:XP_002140138.1 hypothetical protein [Cryptosporidium muris RN66]